MAELVNTVKIDYYRGLIFKHRWLVIIPFCVALCAGIYLSLTLPRAYQANTLILIEPQLVPANYVKSIVTQDIQSRISTLSQQILSRTNLEKIMTEFQLFSKPEHEKIFKEDKLAAIRKRIQIKVSNSRSRQDNDTFSISYEDSDPLTTMKVTNALATYFIDENLKARESHATGTNIFLDGELNTVRQRLAVIEENIKTYRTKFMGELPEQLTTNLVILERLQEQLIEKQKDLRETRAMMATLQQQIDSVPDFSADDFLISFEDDGAAPGENSFEIEELKAKLSQMKLKYTDRHPDVVRIKNTITKLEAQLEADAEDNTAEMSPDTAETDISADLNEMGFQNLQNVQKDEMAREIRRKQNEIDEIAGQIELYQQRVENTPKREQEMLSLKRDYDNIKGSYDSLVQRKLEAEIAVNMERKQKGEQFRIIDHADLPEKPYSPNVKMLFLFSVAIGLGIGGGLIFVLDFLNTSLKVPQDYETRFGLPVLATIPSIPPPNYRILHRINQGLTFVSLAAAAALTAGFGFLVIKGVDTALELVSFYIGQL
ncbi:MAG: protein GumC [bacterium]|nr:protein GumC [bacterium]